MKHPLVLILCFSIAALVVVDNVSSYEVLTVIGGMFIEQGVRYTHRYRSIAHFVH